LRILGVVLLGACLTLTSCSSGVGVIRTLSAVETISEVKKAPEGNYKQPDEEELVYLSSAYVYLTSYSMHVDSLLSHLSEKNTSYNIMQINVSSELNSIMSAIHELQALKVPPTLTARHNEFVSAFKESNKMLDAAGNMVSTRNSAKLTNVRELVASSDALLYDARKVFDEYKIVNPQTGQFVALWKR
jgi:hypothetical protein